MKNLFKLDDLSISEIIEILDDAKSFKEKQNTFTLKDKIVANLFFEPSTRTQYSFVTAEHKLDMKVINFSEKSSSIIKGETFEDTVRTFVSFGVDCLVIRHTQDAYYNQLLNFNIPIINGGDGTGNHPTQSLLDLYTIREHFQKFAGLKVAIVGDIKHSRVAHSNLEVMKRLGMETYISGPEVFKEPTYPYVEFDEAIKTMDIIMLLRIQKERHALTYDSAQYLALYGMTKDRMEKLKPNSIIMHPAPFNRGIEIDDDDDVVLHEKSKIFQQIENGVFVRMAVLKRSLS